MVGRHRQGALEVVGRLGRLAGVAIGAGAQDEGLGRFGIEQDARAEIHDGVLIAPGGRVGHGAVDAHFRVPRLQLDGGGQQRVGLCRLLRVEPELTGLGQDLGARRVGGRLGQVPGEQLELIGRVGKIAHRRQRHRRAMTRAVAAARLLPAQRGFERVFRPLMDQLHAAVVVVDGDRVAAGLRREGRRGLRSGLRPGRRRTSVGQGSWGCLAGAPPLESALRADRSSPEFAYSDHDRRGVAPLLLSAWATRPLRLPRHWPGGDGGSPAPAVAPRSGRR